jgi:4-alpha-glucanotransferase
MRNGGKRMERFREYCEREGEDLRDYAGFMTLKQELGHDKPWNKWDEKFKFRESGYLKYLKITDIQF